MMKTMISVPLDELAIGDRITNGEISGVVIGNRYDLPTLNGVVFLDVGNVRSEKDWFRYTDSEDNS